MFRRTKPNTPREIAVTARVQVTLEVDMGRLSGSLTPGEIVATQADAACRLAHLALAGSPHISILGVPKCLEVTMELVKEE